MKRAGLICFAGVLSLALNLQAQDKPAEEEPEVDTQKQADMPRGPAEIFKRNQERPKAPAGPVVPEPPPGSQAPADQAAPTGHETGEAPAGDQAPHGAQALPEGQVPAQRTTPAQADGQPAGQAPAGQAPAGQAPVGSDPHAGMDAPPLARRPIATAEPNASVPVGAVRVRVVDSTTEKPVPNAAVQLGTMTRENTRKSQDAKTSGDGSYVFEKLATGDGQAYRINVMHDGAKYSSTPFRLPYDTGYEVLIRQLPTTRDARELVLYVGATSVELRDERLKVVQQARLVNIGAKTYVFPEDGTLIKFPPGFTAFQTEEVMTDQRLKETEGGMSISGSIPPGETTLTWGFDIPYSSTELDLSFELPWVTFAYRVLADAAPGMTIEVDELPKPELVEENGRKFWVSEVVKRVGETPLRTVTLHVRGIPGPGPLRIIATVVAILVLIAGVFIARQPPPMATVETSNEELEQRKSALVARAASLEAERERGEIGPEFYAEQIAEIEEQLASLLYEESRIKSAAKQKAA